jgi:hypothetical protein
MVCKSFNAHEEQTARSDEPQQTVTPLSAGDRDLAMLPSIGLTSLTFTSRDRSQALSSYSAPGPPLILSLTLQKECAHWRVLNLVAATAARSSPS